MAAVNLGRPSWLMLVLIISCNVQCTIQRGFNESDNKILRPYGPHDNDLESFGNSDGERELGRRKRYMSMKPDEHWPKAIIPYKYGTVDERNKKDIVASMAFFEYLTHIRFVEWDTSLYNELGHKGFINYVTTWGRGWSLLGFYNSERGQQLDCPRQTFKQYDLLFPELSPFEPRPFYMIKEFCVGYKCEETDVCAGRQLSCANEGYLSVVDGRCSCVCLPGLDPKTSCTTIIGNGQGKWPSGMFSLLEHKDGCPNGYFSEGTLIHHANGDNRMVSPDFKGDLSGVKAQLSFCTQTADSQNGQWPLGSYCFFKKGHCPGQRGVYEGKIELVGDYTNYKGNAYTGYLPDGETGLDPSMEYCCMHTGFPYIPINLPNDKPFILLVKRGQECQQVIGMSSRMEKFGLFTPRIFGDVSYEWDGRTALINYCVYTPADRQCGDIIEMGPQKTTVTIESDKSNPSNRECDWLFTTSPGAKGRFVLTFDEFDVTCSDYVEVQHTLVAQKGVTLCGEVKDKSFQSLYDKLRVQYKSLSNSRSHFKATIKWIPDNEMCYDASRNGATYRGLVNYTRNFEPCLPWSEVTKCLAIPNSFGFYLSDLEDNKCRNPDNSFYPWCYTSLDGCKRDFCDVCQLEKPYDRAEDCAERKRKGECNVDSVDCAETCAIIKQGPAADVRPVTCSRPGTIYGGNLEGPHKASYNLGDSVTFKCRRSGNTVEVSCQGDGNWTTAKTACLPCPEGYTNFRDDCYKFHNKYVGCHDAEDYCASTGAELAIPRNQGENDFFVSFRYPLNTLWMGAKYKDNKYLTKKGDSITWFNWRFDDVPHIATCVSMDVNGLWHDSYGYVEGKNIICRVPVTDDKPDCKDFLDNCPDVVSRVQDSNCDLRPGLEAYCRYTCSKCPAGCQQDVRLTELNRAYTISADRSRSSSRFCTWNIKAPSKDGRLVLKFEEFDVRSNKENCVDGVEVRSKIHEPPYTRFCNAHYNKTVIMKEDQLIVNFITPDPSTSHFKANIEWIPDSDMCYNVLDKGWSYDGKVNYTNTFEACLPWAEAFNCENNTLWNAYFIDTLEENYCRNPHPERNEEQPYCYTKDCFKKYCDVCHLEDRSDNSQDCQSFKNSGKCQLDPLGAATKCAGTCRSYLDGAKIKASTVSCPRPGRISDGTMVSDVKNRYKVGDKARYKCKTSDFYIERMCLTSGTWSTANSACRDCPHGFIPYEDQCYRYFPLYVDKDGANDHCNKMGGVVASPMNAEQNHFIASIREGKRIWLGGTKSTYYFMWNDVTRITWLNWEKAGKSYRSRDDCMVLEMNERWTDDWCTDKLFHFVCQVKPQSGAKDCVDFLNTCPSLVQAVPGGDCTNFPSLRMDCRSSCGLCLSDCKKSIRLGSNNQIYHIDSRREGFCNWNFKGDGKKGRFIITLDQFNVKSPDSLVISVSDTEPAVHKYFDNAYQKVTYVYRNNLKLDFKGSSNTNSNFQATIRWVKDADMCYDVKDKGWSYVGKVSFTKSYQTCIPWGQTWHCGHSSFKIGDFMDNLDSNYCRNPDRSDQPWCYTDNCRKQTCDVCHLEKLEDVGDDCVERKNRGECTEESTDCAKTCELDKYVKRVSNTRCGKPSQVSGGQFQGPIKNQYNVGDTVTYKCSRSSFTVSRVCLSSGEWSVANTACLGCPLDFFEFQGQCYMYVEKKLNYTDAEKECQKYGSMIATPKSLKHNKFITSLRYTATTPTDDLWIGARKNEKKNMFISNDNTPLTWTRWQNLEKMKDRDNCIAMGASGFWTDDWCHDKYFNFVCQQKYYDQPECKDFLDDCPHRLSLTNKPVCDPDSRMEALCRRTCGLCPKDCDHTVELSDSVPAYEMNWDRRKDSSRLCTWRFSVSKSKPGRYIVQFEDFDIQDHGIACTDTVEVKDSIFGSPEKAYCNWNKDVTMEILGHSLFVRFKTIANSRSHIKARVTWIADDSMCYNVKDNGRSYDGNVNYSKTFEPCLSWAQTQNCGDHPLKDGVGRNLISHLHGNACRNPDNSERPWCYTHRCQKEFCDVCHLEKPYDNEPQYCDRFKSEGKCSSDPVGAIKECAATCNAVPSSQSDFKAIHVTCGTPKQVSGAVLSSPEQDTYKVGDVVTYKCPRSASVVSSMCLTSGEWSDAKTPCLSCPTGWTQFGDKCYRKVMQYLEYVDAEVECKKLSAIVAPAKTKAINDFLVDLKGRDTIWIGGKKSKDTNQFFWSDGDQFSWTNWAFSRDLTKRDKCILLFGAWRDDWCHDKFYPFVCQLDTDDKPDCIDFMDSCSDYVQYKNNQCNAILNQYCRQSCGLCNN